MDAAKCYLRYGVTPNEYTSWRFYELSHLARTRFYTARDSSKWEARFNNPDYADYFNQKHLTNKLFSDFIRRDWIYTEDSTIDTIHEFLATHPKVIAKPVGLSSGRGIHVVHDENIDELKSSGYLLEEFIIQHSKMATLNQSSVNSVRVYTLSLLNMAENISDEAKTLFLSASIRVGGVGAEVDNFHAGGVGYPIDLETGIVSAAGTTIAGEKVLFHPGSGKKVVGFEVPNWNELKRFVVKLDQVVPEARLVAWDVAILENGFELIEANYDGDPGFMQAPSQTGLKKIIVKNFR